MSISSSLIYLIIGLVILSIITICINFKRINIVLKIVSILIIVTIIASPLIAIYVLNNGNPYTKLLTSFYVPQAIEEFGYSEEDILRMEYFETKHVINKDFYHGHYLVIFKDEPNVAYYYGLKKRGKDVVQFCEHVRVDEQGFLRDRISGGAHSDKACISSLDNRD